MLELKYQTCKHVNVPAGPRTKLISEKSFLMQNYIQIHCFVFPPSTSTLLLTSQRVQKPHLKPSKRQSHTVLNGKNLPKRSCVRKFEAKDGFTPRTQPTTSKQFEGDIKIFLLKTIKSMSGNAENKTTVLKYFSFGN